MNAAVPDNVKTGADLQSAALQKAQEVADERGLQNPTLLFETGVPDLKIILNKGEIAAIYCRNSHIVPAITVMDLDYSEQPEKEAKKLQRRMDEEKFELVPHAME